MEKIFLEILATQKEILAELRLIREAVGGREAPVAALAEPAAETGPAPEAMPAASVQPFPEARPLEARPPEARPVEAPAPPRVAEEPDADAPFKRLEEAFGPFAQGLDMKKSRHAPKLTLQELQDIGGSFLEGQGKKLKPEAESSRDSIMDTIKERNRKKRDAFSEFERLTRNR